MDGDFKFLLEDHPQVVMYLLKCARQTLLVVCNFSNETVPVEIPEALNAFTWERLLTNRDQTEPSLERKDNWLPWEAEIYQVKL